MNLFNTEADGSGADCAPHPESEAVRRIREFGQAYLGISQQLFRHLLSAESGRDLGQLRKALKENFEHMYMPAFSGLHMQQQSTERLLAASLRWQRAAARVSELLSSVATIAVEKLIANLSAPESSGPPVTTLRQLHDLWVECGESAYGAAAHGEDFAAAQAELLAAMVEMRFEQRRQIEDWARAFNLPTRSEIDSIHKRLHDIGRVLRELQKR